MMPGVTATPPTALIMMATPIRNLKIDSTSLTSGTAAAVVIASTPHCIGQSSDRYFQFTK